MIEKIVVKMLFAFIQVAFVINREDLTVPMEMMNTSVTITSLHVLLIVHVCYFLL